MRKIPSLSCFKRYILWLFAGFLLGITMCCLMGNRVIDVNKQLLFGNLELLKNSSVNGTQIFSMLTGKRLIILVLLAVAGLSNAGKSLFNLFLVWSGTGCGLFACFFIKICGIKGVLIIVSFLLPQYLVYIPAIGILYGRVCRLHGDYKYANKDISIKKKNRSKSPLSEYAVCVIGVSVMIFVGIVLEAYINPVLIKKILTIL